MGMGMNYGGQMGGYGGGYGGQMNNMYGGNTGNMRSVPQKSVNKPAPKKPVNNNYGGGFNNNFKGGYSGGGMMDNRPIGGGMDMGMNPEEGEPTMRYYKGFFNYFSAVRGYRGDDFGKKRSVKYLREDLRNYRRDTKE